MNKCALCHKSKILRDSHIFPKFVFKWMKKTGSGNFRIPTSVNIRRQDGPTKKLLCDTCEGIFGVHETWFSKNLFHPILNEMLKNDGNVSSDYNYNEHFYKFSISLLWRILLVNIESGDYPKEYSKKLHEVLEDWRLFLLNDIYPSSCDNIHYLIIDISHDFDNKPENFDFYLARATDGTIGHGGNRLMVYTKIARFVIFAQLNGFNENDYKNTKISPIKGNVIQPQYVKDGEMGSFIISRVEDYNKHSSNLSEKQISKIEEMANKEMDKLYGSDLHRAMSNQSKKDTQ